jgi:hypothetical protein
MVVYTLTSALKVFDGMTIHVSLAIFTCVLVITVENAITLKMEYAPHLLVLCSSNGDQPSSVSNTVGLIVLVIN